MASFNTSHHDGSGGVVLFSGELILLFCDNVEVSIDGKGKNVTGRMYLTTHRIIFTAKNFNSNPNLRSFSAPFYAMFDLNLEQPIFGANYIKGKVRTESQPDSPIGITFKLKFNNGGAIEFGQAMDSAARQARLMASQTQFEPPPPYTPDPNQFYQAPPNVYQPAYNCGFTLPTNVFPTPPPAGFIYAMDAPPPYPGLNTQPQPYTAYPQAYPAYGYQMPNYNSNPSNGDVNVNQPAYNQPAFNQPAYNPNYAAGYPTASGNQAPPSYSEATKKTQ